MKLSEVAELKPGVTSEAAVTGCFLVPQLFFFFLKCAAGFLSKINDFPVFSYRISLLRVYTAVRYDLKKKKERKKREKKTQQDSLLEARKAKVCERKACRHSDSPDWSAMTVHLRC